MDVFLEKYGMRVPCKAGTTTSVNSGVTTVIAENAGKFYINNLWSPYGRLTVCHLAVPSVYTGPQTSDDDKNKTPTYSIRLLLNPLGCGEIEEACVALAHACQRGADGAKWGPVNYGNTVYSVEQRLFDPHTPPELRILVPLLNGDMRYGLNPTKEGTYQGLRYLNAKMYPTIKKTGAAQRPLVLDQAGKPMVNPADLKNGWYVTAKLSLSTYMTKGVPGIRAGFDTVRLVALGDEIVTGYDGEGAALAAVEGMESMDFGSFVTQQPQMQPGYPAPGGYPAAPPQGYLPVQPGYPPQQPQWQGQPPQGYPPQQPQGQGQPPQGYPPGGVPVQPGQPPQGQPPQGQPPQGQPVGGPGPVWQPPQGAAMPQPSTGQWPPPSGNPPPR